MPFVAAAPKRSPLLPSVLARRYLRISFRATDQSVSASSVITALRSANLPCAAPRWSAGTNHAKRTFLGHQCPAPRGVKARFWGGTKAPTPRSANASFSPSVSPSGLNHVFYAGLGGISNRHAHPRQRIATTRFAVFSVLLTPTRIPA